uniref:Uncharacterized protein n=1 Tax=viral metagenome TaxID=1070528 RepID=A0A6C0J6S6_9ZZZZ
MKIVLILLCLFTLYLFTTCFLPYHVNNQNLKHLKSFRCNPELYNIIKKVKNNYSSSETIRIETSKKITKDNTIIWDRYVVFILLSEWHNYTEAEQIYILDTVGFKLKHIKKILSDNKHNIKPDTDIIIGRENTKGKIYLDFDGKLVCYESNTLINRPTKTYEKSDENNDILTVRDANRDIIGKHYRLNGKNNIYWRSEVKSGTSYYFRPGNMVSIMSNIIDMFKILRSYICV